MSEVCCMWLAENTGRKKSPKIRHLDTIAQLCRVTSLQLRHASTIGKSMLISNTSNTYPHNMANFGPLTAEIGSGVWGTPANFNGKTRNPFKLAGVPQTNEPIPAASGSKFTTLCGYVGKILLLNNFSDCRYVP